MSQERLETEGKLTISADLSQSFMLKEDYVMCKLNLCPATTKTESFRTLAAQFAEEKKFYLAKEH